MEKLLRAKTVSTIVENEFLKTGLYGNIIKKIYLTEQFDIMVEFMYPEYNFCKKTEDFMDPSSNNTQLLNLAIEKFIHEIEQIFLKILIQENFQDKIFFEILNAKENAEVLKELPHKTSLNFAFVYRMMVSQDKKSITSFRISNLLMESLGLDKEFLHHCAIKNTPKILPLAIEEINDYEKFMDPDITTYPAQGKKKSLKNSIEKIVKNTKGVPMWVISTPGMYLGAVYLYYGRILNAFAEACNDDLYIIPSSCHEIMVMAVSSANPFELVHMLRKMNEKDIVPEERLSNDLYFFNKDERTLKILKTDYCYNSQKFRR